MDVPSLLKKYFPFEKYRDQQFDAMQYIAYSLTSEGDKYFILESPTGVGKSVVGYTVSKTISDLLDVEHESEEDGPEIIICTSTKQLQTQYIESFQNHSDVSYIWSAENYPCDIYYENEGTDEKVYYGHPLCQKKKCPSINICKYVKQKKEFFKSRIGITNYHYFFNFKKLKPVVLVADEAHNIEKILSDQASITLSERYLISFSNNILRNSQLTQINIDKFLKMVRKIVKKDEIDIENDIKPYAKEFIQHFQEILKKVILELDKLKKHLRENDKKTLEKISKLAKTQKNITNTIQKYKLFLKSKTDWIISQKNVERENHKVVIKPLEIFEYFQSHVGDRVCRGIFMSATICGADEFAKQLGLEKSHDSLETKSIIPIENRPVYFCNNIGSMNYKNKNQILPKFVEVIDRIVKYQHGKSEKIHGIIHSVSYSNATYLKNHSKYKDQMIVPQREDLIKLNETIKKFKDSTIIVSPSILEGIDLLDELSRFQIFLKVPYAFLGDAWVKNKMNKNPKWYSREAIIKIVQGSGRSIRSEDDWAETFILDSNFGRLLKNDNDLIPEWFKSSVKIVQV